MLTTNEVTKKKICAHDRVIGLGFLLSIVVGCVIAWSTPPFSNPDEGAHYLRAYEVSVGHWVNSRNQIGVLMPCTEYLTAAKKYGPVAFYQAEAEQLKPSATTCFVNSRNTAGTYSPFPYLAAAIGIRSVRVFGGGVETQLRVGRLMNLVLTTALCFFAVRLLPTIGILLAFFILIPASLWLRSSLSADAFTICLCIIYIAEIFRYLEERAKLSPGGIIRLSIFAFFLGSMKPVYGILALASLSLIHRPTNVQDFIKQSIILLVPVAIGLMAGGIWVAVADPSLVYVNKFGGADPSLQSRWIFENPLSFMRVVWHSLAGQCFTLIGQAVWPVLSIIPNVSENSRIAVIAILVCVLLTLVVTTPLKIKLWQRAIVVGCALVCTIAVTAPLYITYTLVGHKEIIGLQGRYFLPIASLGVSVIAFSREKIIFINRNVQIFLGIFLPIFISMLIVLRGFSGN